MSKGRGPQQRTTCTQRGPQRPPDAMVFFAAVNGHAQTPAIVVTKEPDPEPAPRESSRLARNSSHNCEYRSNQAAIPAATALAEARWSIPASMRGRCSRPALMSKVDEPPSGANRDDYHVTSI